MNVFNEKGMSPPPPPAITSGWIERLRWLVAVMNEADRSLGFAAGCLSSCVARGHLTERQEAGCQAIWQRVTDAFFNIQLDCQDMDRARSQQVQAAS